MMMEIFTTCDKRIDSCWSSQEYKMTITALHAHWNNKCIATEVFVTSAILMKMCVQNKTSLFAWNGAPAPDAVLFNPTYMYMMLLGERQNRHQMLKMDPIASSNLCLEVDQRHLNQCDLSHSAWCRQQERLKTDTSSETVCKEQCARSKKK